ncbi:type VI secretion system baseplate subunit TssF [Prevotella melaninogenica]|uniref:Type VI secretion system baseplate subunit TssF n=1 Tax=Prevotella melaninogenica TaxID=28132 RepID=A0A250KIT5_9BACT|nr:type VI secretion system baseplate subunit TssF [Prevotella melaninogenica]BBA29608.1 hypothetical protein PMEL_200123 [Prevotella melaninogenica]
MIDKRQQSIKERLRRFAMDLWNITDLRQVDPVIDLILDVIAYNSSRLHQNISDSDSSVLHRLACLLVPQQWSLPMPSHALLSVEPKDDESRLLTPQDRFYTRKMMFEKGWVDLDFSPLSNYPLVNAKIKGLSYDSRVMYSYEGSLQETELSNVVVPSEDGVVWIGLEMTKSLLRSTHNLVLCVLLEDNNLTPFLRDVQVYDGVGEKLDVSVPQFPLEHSEKYHYFDEISDYYANNFIQISLDSKVLSSNPFSTYPSEWEVSDEDGDEGNKLVWLKLKFPVMFNHVDLGKIRFLLNTYPVVNRTLITVQHNFARKGNIVALPCKENRFLLNVESFHDDANHQYVDIAHNYSESSIGTYSLYFGNIERFDSDNARILINKLIQLIHEDGSAFESLEIDTLTDQLNNLYDNIENIEKSIFDFTQAKSIPRAFLFTHPYKKTSEVEVSYWTTDAEVANGLDSRTVVYQSDNDKFSTSGLLFQTTTKQGNAHESERDLINRLRYGLLSKDRIVTREDIKSFVLCRLGKLVKSVDIRDGIAISSDVRRGIIRTTEVRIELSRTSKEEGIDLPAMTSFLEDELSKRSINNTPYKIFFV